MTLYFMIYIVPPCYLCCVIIQRFKDSKIQRFKDSKIQRFKDSKLLLEVFIDKIKFNFFDLRADNSILAICYYYLLSNADINFIY